MILLNCFYLLIIFLIFCAFLQSHSLTEGKSHKLLRAKGSCRQNQVWNQHHKKDRPVDIQINKQTNWYTNNGRVQVSARSTWTKSVGSILLSQCKRIRLSSRQKRWQVHWKCPCARCAMIVVTMVFMVNCGQWMVTNRRWWNRCSKWLLFSIRS